MSRDIDEISLERAKLVTKTEQVYFFDLNKNGILAPKTKNLEGRSDLAILVNEQAVMESVYNILMTEPGEHVMDPNFGVYLERYLFEPIDSTTALNIMREIYDSLIRLENRIINLEVIVTPDVDQNTFVVDIYFAINNNNKKVKFNSSLEKLR